MTDPGRRVLTTAVLCCVGGGALLLLVAGRDWATAALDRPSPLPATSRALTGRSLEPVLPALGLLGLAGVVAIAATRSRGRVVLGLLLALGGTLAVARAAARVGGIGADEAVRAVAADGRGLAPPGTTAEVTAHPGWPLLAVVGGALLLAGGLLTVVAGRRWPALGRRYERPAAPPSPAAPSAGTPISSRADEPRLWEALDRGEDPTAR